MVTWLLVFMRCTGFVFRAPGFAHPSVPPAMRAGLAAAIALAIAPTIPSFRGASDLAFGVALVTEFLLGSAIGMTASLVYDAAYAGGRVVDDYVGVKAIAPSLQLVAPSGFGRVWSLAFTGGFFLWGAYRPLIAAFAGTFDRVAPGGALHPDGWTGYVGAYADTLVAVALQVAAPAVALAFVVQIGLGALSRAVPRFGSFTLAFPLALAAAIVATVVAAPIAVERAPFVALPRVIP